MTAGFSSKDRLLSTFILTLGMLPGVGPRKVQSLLETRRDAIESAGVLDEEFAWSLGDRAVDKGLSSLERNGASWLALEKRADGILDRSASEGVHVLNPYMDEYPRRLLANGRHPPIIYCMGDLALLNTPKSVAIIGTREPTEFGRRMGRRLASILAEDGYAIVSGLALGCDTTAHEGALDVGGATLAVLPTPMGAPVYPRQNQGLADRIIDGGGLLFSEYPPGMELQGRQLARNLVARDEWQPALSDGVVAIETSVTGGTTHAIEHARDARVPIAVFDYSSRPEMRFFEDGRFGGNVKYLREGASSIFLPETVDQFKSLMTGYRRRHDDVPVLGGTRQLAIEFE